MLGAPGSAKAAGPGAPSVQIFADRASERNRSLIASVDNFWQAGQAWVEIPILLLQLRILSFSLL
jgi:hypothetical protein